MRGAPKIAAPRRVLIKEVNWLGDLVMSMPALRAIRRAWPQAHLAVLVKRELAGFFDSVQSIDEVISYSIAGGARGFADTAALIGTIRSRRFDLAILFPNSFSSAVWMALAGVKIRAGYARDGRSPLLTHKTSPPADAMNGHQVRYWLAMVRETMGIAGNEMDFLIEPYLPHAAKMRDWLEARRRGRGAALVAIAPAAAYGPAKEWPADRYATLIDMLADRFAIESVLVGAPSERARCEHIAKASGSGAIVAAGETGVGELIGLLSLCAGFVGNDSGVMHVAAALGIPAVAIFGSTNPARTGPLGPSARVIYRGIECSPCLEHTCRFSHYNCFKSIGPEEVARALESAGGLRARESAIERAGK